MPRNIRDDENIKFLLSAVLELKDLDECYDFFEDLCTMTELKSMSQRIVVAKMLDDKKVYSEIVKTTGASTATVSRVKRSLLGGKGSYKRAFKRMEK